jgi:hypothetical protein
MPDSPLLVVFYFGRPIFCVCHRISRRLFKGRPIFVCFSLGVFEGFLGAFNRTFLVLPKFDSRVVGRFSGCRYSELADFSGERLLWWSLM